MPSVPVDLLLRLRRTVHEAKAAGVTLGLLEAMWLNAPGPKVDDAGVPRG